MGKKSTAKKFRKLAAELPTLHQKANEKSVVSGEKLIELGITKLSDNSKVELGKKYYKTDEVLTIVNHARRLRKHAAKFGQAGIVGYIRSVNQYVEQQKNQLWQTSSAE